MWQVHLIYVASPGTLAAISMATQHFKNTSFVLLLGLISFPSLIFAQLEPTYKMEFVKSVQIQSPDKNNILAFFKVTPLIKDFKFVLSMRVTYEIGQGAKTINVQKQKEDKIRFTVYGKDMPQKYPKTYDLIKDKLRLDSLEDPYILKFDFFNITKTQIDTMTILYGLWEGEKMDIRNEKTFNFKVEQIK